MSIPGNGGWGSASRYLHGPAVDEVLAREEIGTALPIEWVYTDHLGSVRDVVANNYVTYHMDFTAFGQLQAGSNAWYYGFTGREYDHNTGLNYHRSRWLDSRIGRWITEDPVGFAALDANLNRYARNRVTTQTDALGLQEDRHPRLRSRSWGSLIDAQSKIGLQQSVQRAGDAGDVLGGALYGVSFGPIDAWCQSHKLTYNAVTDPLGTADAARMAAGSAIYTGFSFTVDPSGTISNWWNSLSPRQQGQVIGGAYLSALGMAYGLSPRRRGSAVDGFESFAALKRALGSPGEGNVWHHIVEQRPNNIFQFGPRVIHCKNNVISVPREVNQRIADYYSSKRRYTSGTTVREWLDGQSFEKQDRFGRQVLDYVLGGKDLP